MQWFWGRTHFKNHILKTTLLISFPIDFSYLWAVPTTPQQIFLLVIFFFCINTHTHTHTHAYTCTHTSLDFLLNLEFFSYKYRDRQYKGKALEWKEHGAGMQRVVHVYTGANSSRYIYHFLVFSSS